MADRAAAVIVTGFGLFWNSVFRREKKREKRPNMRKEDRQFDRQREKQRGGKEEREVQTDRGR